MNKILSIMLRKILLYCTVKQDLLYSTSGYFVLDTSGVKKHCIMQRKILLSRTGKQDFSLHK
jgi:hypothetical protein